MQLSEETPNGFTLKTRVTRCNDQGGNFINAKHSRFKRDDRLDLQPEEAATFVDTRTPGRNGVYLQVVDSEEPEYLVGRLKKVKLRSTEKTA